jgi:ferrochelatase
MASLTSRTGILLINLGTPAAATPKAVRQYLREFLSDPYVVALPRLPWKILLNTLILPLRSPKTACNYQKIWLAEGSPLRVYTQQLAEQLQTHTQCPVAIGMRYGQPSIKEGLIKLQQMQVDNIIILPLFPQYSTTTTASVMNQIQILFAKYTNLPPYQFIHDYHAHPAYIAALAKQVEQYWQEHGKGQVLLMSFHGLPERTIKQGDPYASQCETTATLLANQLGLNRDQWQLCYQSRFGKAKWITPYTVDVLTQLPATGITQVDIISPGFAVDCLETLEELAIQNKAIYEKAGGQVYHYIPALNANAAHVTALDSIIRML